MKDRIPMSDKEKTIRFTNLCNFYHTSARNFNENFSGGNRLAVPDDAPVYFCMLGFIGMATVVKLDGQWICEVTNGYSTGIAQSGFYDDPHDAWKDTKKQLIVMYA